jgi:hypothetical protein
MAGFGGRAPQFVLVSAIALAGLIPVRSDAQSLEPVVDNDRLRVRAPSLRFIDGEALETLRDGGSVTFALRLGASGRRGGPALEVVERRFSVSYDLWEERFAVSSGGADSAAISHLSARDAEAWCLENLSLPAPGLGASPFWLRVEHRVEETVGGEDPDGNSLFTLGGLIDTFSRLGVGERPNGSVESGPFRLSEIR